ncbi:MAG: ROK family protein [Candidatus Omnitrophica bacterium]|nr:ROK family protein [Candidatus Omnitrophota bacterium]
MREFTEKEDRLTEKERRNLDILDTIRRKREVSRADISKLTGLNIVTVSNYVNTYIKKGLVYEMGLDISTGGRRPELLRLNKEYGYSIGVDLGAPHIVEDTVLTACLLDVTSKVVAKEVVKKCEEPQDKFIERVNDLIERLVKKSGIEKEKIKGVGFGIWGPLDRYKGTARYAVEKGGTFSYIALQKSVEDKFNMHSVVEHDSMVAALGEKWAGIGLEEGVENILFVCSDSSVGLIIKGELYYGATKGAGELNINPPMTEEEIVAPVRCWEGYQHGCCLRSRGIDLGIPTYSKIYFQRNKDAKSKILDMVKGNLDKITFDIVIKAAKDGDKLAVKFIQEAGAYLGAKIAYLVNLFNPEAVVIGRGVEKAGETLMEAVKKTVKMWGYEEAVKVVKVIPTSLGENAVAVGAGALVVQKIFTKIS